MRQTYTKVSVALSPPYIAKAPIAADYTLLCEVVDKVQNPLQFVTNFAALNLELLADLDNAIVAGSKEDIAAVIEAIAHNSRCIEYHGKRASQYVAQLNTRLDKR